MEIAKTLADGLSAFEAQVGDNNLEPDPQQATKWYQISREQGFFLETH